MKEIVQTSNAPKAIGPYVQAVKVGNIIYTSGQIPLTPGGEVIEADIVKQSEQVMKNLQNVLEAGGSSLKKVIKTTCFISDMNNFSKFNEVYSSFFKDEAPARSCVEVARLPKDVLIEVEAIAEID